jgi:hypothetical protein
MAPIHKPTSNQFIKIHRQTFKKFPSPITSSPPLLFSSVLFQPKNEYKTFIYIIIIYSDMSSLSRVEQMKEIQSEALELFTKKNADYGDAFAKYGVIGVLMRIEDKLQRSMSITKNGVNLVNDEGIRDTLLDLHNYSAMALMLLEKLFF